METKEIKATISKEFSKSAWIMLACWIAIFTLFTTLCFKFGKEENFYDNPFVNNDSYYWYELKWLGIEYGEMVPLQLHHPSSKNFSEDMLTLVIFLNILIFTIVPLIYLLINRRKRKLSELTAHEKEIVGSYTGFIPISKVTLKMPIEKIDNIAAVKNFFFLYTGKALRIASTSGVIRIPYVLNADEVVAFISEAIEKAKKEQAISQHTSVPQPDAADSIKKLAELRDSGIITEEEFNQKKSELLNKM